MKLRELLPKAIETDNDKAIKLLKDYQREIERCEKTLKNLKAKFERILDKEYSKLTSKEKCAWDNAEEEPLAVA